MSEELDFGFLTGNQKKDPIFHLSVVSNTLSPDVALQLEIMQTNGVKFLELQNALEKSVANFSDSDLKQIEAAIKAQGVQVSAVGSNIGRVNITEPFEPELARFERVLEVADWISSSYIRIYGYELGDDEDEQHSQHFGEVVRRMNAFTELAMPYGLILLLENTPGTYGNNATNCAALIDEVGSANLRSAFNPANFGKVGELPFTDAYAPLEPQLTYLYLQTGEVDDTNSEITSTIAALKERGYQGYVTLSGPFDDASFTQTLDKLRAML